MKHTENSLALDLEAAREMTGAFADSCGVCCRLYGSGGQLLDSCGSPGTDCAFCRAFCRQTGTPFACEELHWDSAGQAERFGGRYIYSCPLGMAFFASPILMGGRLAGALVGGPVLLTDIEDFLASDTVSGEEVPEEALQSLRAALAVLPRMEPRRLSQLSRQLFADAVFISDSTHEQFQNRRDSEQQNSISDYIIRLKASEEPVSYPLDKEEELFQAIARGDRDRSSQLLNELLGHIFFYTKNDDEIRTRISELLVVLSRAAVHGGANAGEILSISHQYMQEMRLLRSQGELTRWLASRLNRLTNLVFTMLEGKHANAMQSAADFIRDNYARPLTLAQVAEHVGYSSAYFSRIFKEEMGSGFKEYLNDLRIEKSKALLLSGAFSVAEVCHLVGFNDQSYFCKSFRRSTGTSPDKFRKRVRRIDSQREQGLK